MPSLQTARRVANAKNNGAKTIGQIYKEESDWAMEQTWDNDIQSKICYIYDFYHDDQPRLAEGTTINNSLNTIKNSVNENTSAITQVTMSANGNNLLRNSDTLIFDEYIIGSKLIDASNNILVDRNGYILVG